jgi:hypothetical protein
MRSVNEEQAQRHPLDDGRAFTDRIIYAKDWQKDAMVLYFQSTHITQVLNTTGRLLITSREPTSGKTTVLDAAAMMCHNFWMADPTKWALQAKFIEPGGVTVGMDEISQVFGASGLRGRGNPLYKPMVEGYRRTATFSVSVDRSPMDVSSYCPVVMAGLKTAAPPDLRARSIIIEMRQCPATVNLEDSLDEGVEADGRRIGEQMHAWAKLHIDEMPALARAVRRLHPKLKGRRLQIWGPLGAVAIKAGPEWEARFLAAFTALALDESEKPVLSAEEQVLMDTAAYLNDPATPESRYLLSADLLAHLRKLDEKLYTSKSDRQMAILMTAGLGAASVLTLAAPTRRTAKGWHADAVRRAGAALVAALAPAAEEEQEDEFDDFFDVETTETTETTERAA